VAQTAKAGRNRRANDGQFYQHGSRKAVARIIQYRHAFWNRPYGTASSQSFLIKLFSRFLRRYLALIAPIIVIALYAVLVGAEPPVLGAARKGGLAALAVIAGHKSDWLTSLATGRSLHSHCKRHRIGGPAQAR